MINRTTKLRWRRRFRRSQKQLEGISYSTEERLDRHFFRRLGRLYEVRRFTVAWLLLSILLITGTVMQLRSLGAYYLKVEPIPGGIYSEGIVGSFTNTNPIFATTEVDTTVTRLVFSSLFNFDQNGQLVGDLAESISVDPGGKTYTIKLKSNLYWHDGAELTAEDVAFTFQTIQNPDTKSPLFVTWQGVKIAVVDDHTLTFTLPNILASFPQSLTTGILPEHLLGDLPIENLRSANFNTLEPVGSGPFKWNGVEVRGNEVDNREQRISLVPNELYYNGRPKINEFIVRTFLDEGRMISSFDSGELTAMAGVENITDEQRESVDVTDNNIPMTGLVTVFFRNSQEVLNNSDVRRGLSAATDTVDILRQLTYPSIITTGPLLKSMVGYDPAIKQQGFDPLTANLLLERAGWVLGEGGYRYKDGKKLALTLNTLSNVEYATVAGLLQKQWTAVGVDLTVRSLDQRELQTAIQSRSYDVLLYGIAVGTDPDQYAYWHSSQADPRSIRRFNFSEYSSKSADAALDAGRTRHDPALRAAKYKPFLEAWRNDAPAKTLYQPRYLYVTRGSVANFDPKTLTVPSDRFANVQEWMVRTERVSN